MDLVTAFRKVGPRTGNAWEDECSELAAAVILSELDRLSRSSRHRSTSLLHLLADAKAQVVLRLISSGPRGVREDDPDSPVRVRAYLQASLRHASLDLLPRERVQDDLPDVTAPARPAFEDAAAQLAQDLRQLLTLVQHEASGTCRSARARAGFLQDCAEIAALENGTRTLDELIDEDEGAEVSTPAQRRRAKNRRYQRHGRCLERQLQATMALERRGRLAAREAEALRVLLEKTG
ncbi:MAG: hypothetical protein AAF533_27335 [Acidobacteriota bacterium]